MADLRADLGMPDLPFVAGEGEGERFVNSQIALLPGAVANTAVALSDGLTTQDGTHFDSASQRLLGIRYADALLTILYE